MLVCTLYRNCPCSIRKVLLRLQLKIHGIKATGLTAGSAGEELDHQFLHRSDLESKEEAGLWLLFRMM